MALAGGNLLILVIAAVIDAGGLGGGNGTAGAATRPGQPIHFAQCGKHPRPREHHQECADAA